MNANKRPSAKRMHKPSTKEVSSSYNILNRLWNRFNLNNLRADVSSTINTQKRRLLVGLFVCLFLFLIWPTLWGYNKSGSLRINRFTGEVQNLSYNGWETTNSGWAYKMLHPDEPKKLAIDNSISPPVLFLTQEEIGQIQWDGATLDFGGNLVINIYNGSNKSISNVTLKMRVIPKSAKSPDIVRDYRLRESDSGGCTPQTNCVFSTPQAYHLDTETQNWQIMDIENVTISQ